MTLVHKAQCFQSVGVSGKQHKEGVHLLAPGKPDVTCGEEEGAGFMYSCRLKSTSDIKKIRMEMNVKGGEKHNFKHRFFSLKYAL